MKKVLLIVAILLLMAASATAAETSKTLTFGWDQTVVDLPNLLKWTLYWSDTTGTGYVKVVDVPYSSGAGPAFTSSQVLLVTGAPGAAVKKYFMLKATSKNLNESGPSNEVNYTFQLPYPNVSVPFTLQIIVTP